MKYYNQLSNEEKEKIIVMRHEGITVPMIAEKLQVSVRAVQKTSAELGFKYGPVHSSMRRYDTLDEDDINCVIQDFLDGLNYDNISKRHNVSKRTIQRIMKENNIDTTRRYTLNENYFSSIDNPNKAYILGLLYADGFVGNEHYNNVVLSLKESDVNLLNNIRNELEITKELRYSPPRKDRYSKDGKYVLSFSSSLMANDLRNLGLYSGKSTTLENLPDIPQELMWHFIRGYFDGDGFFSIYKTTNVVKGKTYRYPTICMGFLGTWAFLEKIKQYLPGDFRFSKTTTPEIAVLRSDAKPTVLETATLMYTNASLFLERKREKLNSFFSPFMSESIKQTS